MAKIPDVIPWIPRLLPLLPPPNTPTIDEQLRCPPGTHRELGRGCVPDAPPRLVEVPTPPPAPRTPTGRERPPPKDAFVGPIVQPPVVSPPVVSTPAPVDSTTGRYFPRSGRTTGGVLGPVLNTAGALAWVLGTLVFGPYFGVGNWDTRAEPRSSGPPRRNRPRARAADDIPPYYRYEGPWPYMPGTPLPGPIPLPRRTPNVPAPRSQPRSPPRTATPTPVPAPSTRPVPRTRAPVSPLPAGWTLGDPILGPGYDPFTYAPPTPQARPVPRAPSRRARPRIGFPLPYGPIGVPGDVGRPLVDRPLTRQPRPLTPQQPFNPLTPLNDPVPTSQPQALRKPTSANPCTTERTARRRRQQKCKRFKSKTIRVCADK